MVNADAVTEKLEKFAGDELDKDDIEALRAIIAHGRADFERESTTRWRKSWPS